MASQDKNRGVAGNPSFPHHPFPPVSLSPPVATQRGGVLAACVLLHFLFYYFLFFPHKIVVPRPPLPPIVIVSLFTLNFPSFALTAIRAYPPAPASDPRAWNRMVRCACGTLSKSRNKDREGEKGNERSPTHINLAGGWGGGNHTFYVSKKEEQQHPTRLSIYNQGIQYKLQSHQKKEKSNSTPPPPSPHFLLHSPSTFSRAFPFFFLLQLNLRRGDSFPTKRHQKQAKKRGKTGQKQTPKKHKHKQNKTNKQKKRSLQ